MLTQPSLEWKDRSPSLVWNAQEKKKEINREVQLEVEFIRVGIEWEEGGERAMDGRMDGKRLV